MSRTATVIFLLVALWLPASVGAIGKSKVDPNAGRSQASAVTTSSADVTQKVTYEARRKTVLSILTDLSQMTGVTFKAGYNNEDWQVRDRRMNIFVKDIPLTNLMDSIARVMKFQWSKREDNKGIVSYRLYMDRNVLLGAERQRYIEEEKLKQRQTEARQKFLSGLQAAAGMSEGELESLKTKSPYVYAMTKQGWADTIPQLLDVVPAKQAWDSGESLTINIASLPPALQQKLAETWRKCFRLAMKRSGSGTAFPEKMLDRLGEGSVTINGSQRSWGYNDTALAIGDIAINTPSGGVLQTGLLDPDSELGKIVGNSIAKLSDTSEPSAPLDKEQFQHSIEQAKASQTRELGEPLTEHPEDPALSAKVKVKNERNDFSDALASLATSSDFAVVSDSFERYYQGLTFSGAKIEVSKVLDKLESACHYNWERHGSTLEFHNRDWFVKRAAQIPEAWLETWRTALVNNGLLDLNELSQIAMLTTEQFWVNIRSDELLGQTGVISSINANQDLLCLYASLDKRQRALVLTEQGLSLDSMTVDQLSEAQTLLQRCSASKESWVDLKLVGKRAKKGSYTYYTFHLATQSGDTIGTELKLSCPVYHPPTEKKPKDAKPQQTEKQETKY